MSLRCRNFDLPAHSHAHAAPPPILNSSWGTKLEHIAVIALPLAIADHASIDLWNKVLLKRFGFTGPLSFAGTPGPFLIHGFT